MRSSFEPEDSSRLCLWPTCSLPSAKSRCESILEYLNNIGAQTIDEYLPRLVRSCKTLTGFADGLRQATTSPQRAMSRVASIQQAIDNAAPKSFTPTSPRASREFSDPRTLEHDCISSLQQLTRYPCSTQSDIRFYRSGYSVSGRAPLRCPRYARCSLDQAGCAVCQQPAEATTG